MPSPIDPPAGCHLHLRCPHAVERCRAERPLLVDDASGHATACHRWTELPAAGAIVPEDARPSPALEKLIAAFAAPSDATGPGGVDTVAGRLGVPARD